MKLIFIALFTCLTSLAAFANDHRPTPPPAPQPLIVGEWQADQPHLGGQVWVWTRFNFTASQMTMHSTCEFRNPNVNLTVGVNSDVAYNGNLIYIYERSEGSINDGYRYCNAAISPSTWEFYFTGGDLNHAVIFAGIPSNVRWNVTRVIR
jgi:hypothetical protein